MIRMRSGNGVEVCLVVVLPLSLALHARDLAGFIQSNINNQKSSHVSSHVVLRTISSHLNYSIFSLSNLDIILLLLHVLFQVPTFSF